LLTFLFSATLFAQENDAYLTQLKNHRISLDQTFGDTSKSILPQEMALKFKQLNYFKPNPKFNITAKLKKAIGKAFTMTASSGKKKLFRQYGILSFEIDKKVFKLPIYQNMKLMQDKKYKDHIFIPFTDLTNGIESYAGGRYIEAEILVSKKVCMYHLVT